MCSSDLEREKTNRTLPRSKQSGARARSFLERAYVRAAPRFGMEISAQTVFLFFFIFFEKRKKEDEIAREKNTTIIIIIIIIITTIYLIVQQEKSEELERIARYFHPSSEGKLFEITLGASSQLRVVYLRV